MFFRQKICLKNNFSNFFSNSEKMSQNERQKQISSQNRYYYSSTERFDYLQKLLHEFNVTKSRESKRQVLANLSSFAYNPINYEILHKLNITTTLLNTLQESDDKLRQFAISGLCNLSNDPTFVQKILKNNGLEKIYNCLTENISNEYIIIPSITLFVFFKQFNQISESLHLKIIETVRHLAKVSQNKRIENLTQIYIQD